MVVDGKSIMMDSLRNLTDSIDEIFLNYSISDIEICSHALMVKINDQWGVSSTIEKVNIRIDKKNMSLKELIQNLDFSNSGERSVLIASLNALYNSNVSGEEIKAHHFVEKNFSKKNIAVIGRFPFTKRYKNTSVFNKFFIFDLYPQQGEYGPSDYGKILPDVDVVMMTAQTLVNGTFDQVLSFVNEKSTVLLIGPSTPLIKTLHPKVKILSGAKITNAIDLRESLRSGKSFRHAQGLCFITVRND